MSDAMEPITYQALYKHVRSWISKAIAQAELPTKERLKLSRASTHWLRHTHGSHAVALGVPPDVLQANLGHEDVPGTEVIRAHGWDTSRHLSIAGRYPGFLARPDRWVSWRP